MSEDKKTCIIQNIAVEQMTFDKLSSYCDAVGYKEAFVRSISFFQGIGLIKLEQEEKLLIAKEIKGQESIPEYIRFFVDSSN